MSTTVGLSSIPFYRNGSAKNIQRSLRGCLRQEGHSSSRFGSVCRVWHDWTFGPTSTATPHHTFGIVSSALSWIWSYLHQRPSFVKTGVAQSSTALGDTGVSQGSPLGPLLFSLYMAPLGDDISRFSILDHQYADDTQLYIAVDHETVRSASTNLTACITAVYEWLLHNCLSLNPDKSKSAPFGTVARIKSLQDIVSVNVAGTPISLPHCVKILGLGVMFNENLNFNAQVSAVCKNCFLNIRALRHIRLSMSAETAKMVACAIVSSRLDYCNSVLAGMSDTNFNKWSESVRIGKCVYWYARIISRPYDTSSRQATLAADSG